MLFYGFNGQEKDDEVSGNGNDYDYGFRIYNPRLGRFLSVDPLFKTFAYNSPYAFAENGPIWAIDLDGLEKLKVIRYYDKLGNQNKCEIYVLSAEKVLTSSTGLSINYNDVYETDPRDLPNPDLQNQENFVSKMENYYYKETWITDEGVFTKNKDKSKTTETSAVSFAVPIPIEKPAEYTALIGYGDVFKDDQGKWVAAINVLFIEKDGAEIFHKEYPLAKDITATNPAIKAVTDIINNNKTVTNVNIDIGKYEGSQAVKAKLQSVLKQSVSAEDYKKITFITADPKPHDLHQGTDFKITVSGGEVDNSKSIPANRKGK